MQPTPLSVVIVGPGRLGGTVARELIERGHRVDLVGRGDAIPQGPLTWLTVPDREVAAAASAVPAGTVLLHASGAAGLEILAPWADRTEGAIGSLHPLMTFPGVSVAVPPMAGLPAAVAGHPDAVTAARSLALALDWAPFDLPGDRRLYHAAAVMAGNFSTVLLGLAADLLAAAGVDPDQAPGLLLPLARQSLENAAAVGPAAALTGPVARGDTAVIEAHRAAISGARPELRPVYDALVARAERLGASAVPPPREPAGSAQDRRLPEDEDAGTF